MKLNKISAFVMAAFVLPVTANTASSSNLDRESIERVTVRGAFFGQQAASSLKTPTELVNVPSSLSLVDASQIQNQAFTSIADILQYTPGANIGQGEDHRDQMTIRGQNTTADFFVDGLRDDVQYFRPLYNLERVEILRGANALLFGRGGGGGVVNRVTKTADMDRDFVTLNGGVDSFDAHDIAVDINRGLDGDKGLRLNAFYESIDNHRDAKSGHRFAINPTFSLLLSDQTELTLSYEYVDDERVIDRGLPADGSEPLRGERSTFLGDPEFNYTTFEGHIAKAIIDHSINDNWTVNSTLQWADYDKHYQNYYPTAYNADSGLVTIDNYIDPTTRENLILQANVIGQIETGGIEHTLLMGAEYGDQDTTNSRDEFRFNGSDRFVVGLISRFTAPIPDQRITSRDRASTVNFTSVFIQDEAKVTDWLILVAGLRYDSFDIDVVDYVKLQNNQVGNFARKDTQSSPRLGAIIKPSEDLSFYVSFSKSFLPRSGDQFLSLDLTSAALAPEEFENREVGFKWNPTKQLAFTTAIFEIERENGFVVDPADPESSLLTGTKTRGAELQLVGNMSDSWSINAGISLLDGEEMGRVSNRQLANRTLAQVPERMMSLWNLFEASEALSFGLGIVYQSEQFASLSNNVRLPSFTRVDAAAYYQINDKMRMQFNIENLFDQNYFPAAHNDNNITVGEPLNARVGFSYEF